MCVHVHEEAACISAAGWEAPAALWTCAHTTRGELGWVCTRPCSHTHTRVAPTVQVRGVDIPRPVKTWTQCGINVKVLEVLKKHGFERPLSIQAQVRCGCCACLCTLPVAHTHMHSLSLCLS